VVHGYLTRADRHRSRRPRPAWLPGLAGHLAVGVVSNTGAAAGAASNVSSTTGVAVGVEPAGATQPGLAAGHGERIARTSARNVRVSTCAASSASAAHQVVSKAWYTGILCDRIAC
jgi:hypothetical protein